MSQHFTLEEANDCIPTLEVILRKLNDLVGAMRVEYSDLEQLKEVVRGNGGHDQGNQYLKEIARFASLIHEVNSHGCILKDVSQGLVDFPHMKDGREVYLCWMMGEKSIGWWHERDSGFSGRQPIETL
jgi:hypothetical protein